MAMSFFISPQYQLSGLQIAWPFALLRVPLSGKSEIVLSNVPAIDATLTGGRGHSTAVYDRMAIASAVADWCMFRDRGQWDLLSGLYARNAVMVTTWFRGDAAEFVRRSKAAAERGARVQHVAGSPSISLNGGRAVVDTRMTILLRTKVDGTVVDVTCVGRFHDRFVRENAGWRILNRTPVYDKDRVDAVNPSAPIKLDQVALSRFAEGYRHLAYVQSLAGDALTPGLPTLGSAEEHALYAQSAAWLSDENPRAG
jgi:hypothetical protein